MPFDPKSAKKAGKKSKRGPAKKEGPSIISITSKIYHQVHSMILIGTYISQWILKITLGDLSEVLIDIRKLYQDKNH